MFKSISRVITLKDDRANDVAATGRASWALVALGLIIAGGVILGGWWDYQRQKSATHRSAAEMLSSIADLKAGEISAWLRDCRANAHVAATSYAVSQMLFTPKYVEREGMSRSLDRFREAYGYAAIAVFDRKADLLAATPSSLKQDQLKSVQHHVGDALLGEGVTLVDLHRPDHDAPVHLDLLCPIRVRALPGEPADGVVAVLIDARSYLFPLVQSWPTPSPTAETLLVRRDGNDVVYLNDLRHRANTAVNLRVALDPGMPASMAVQGKQGLVEGHDYRGVPVLAAVRPIADTPWFMVAKVDQEEIDAPVREDARETGKVTALILLGGALGISLLWRKRPVMLTRREAQLQKQAELALRESEERFRLLLEGVPDYAIAMLDQDGRVMTWNEGAQRIFGYAADEIVGLPLPGFRPEAMVNRTRFEEEDWRERKDGSRFWANNIITAVRDAGTLHGFAVVIHDRSETKLANWNLRRMTRLYATLSEVNQAVVRCESREQLFRQICRIAVEHGGFELAWIGIYDAPTRAIVAVAHHGEPADYAASIRVSALDCSEGRGPVGTAFRENRVDVCNDLTSDPRMEPWRARLQRAKLASAAAVPIHEDGIPVGVITFYSAEVDFFLTKEVGLLNEMATNVSFALNHMVSAAALRENEGRFRQLAENSREVFWLAAVDLGKMLYVSPAFEEVWGRSCQSLYQDPQLWLEAVHPDDREHVRRTFLLDRNSGREIHVEYRVVRPDGTIRWVADSGYPVRDVGGNVYRMAGVADDITERKEADERLLASERFAHATIDALPAHICVLDSSGTITAVNRAWRQFAEANPPAPASVWLGANYLAICDASTEPDAAESARHAAAIRAVISGEKEEYRAEYACHSPSDKRWFLMRVSRFGGVGPKPVVVSHSNITERKLVEEALRQAHDEAQAANQAKDRFLAAASHELRTPLTPIMLLGSSLEQDSALPLAVRQDLATMMEHISLEKRLVDDLLDFSAIHAGKLHLRMQAVSLHAILRAAVDTCQPEITRKRLQVDVAMQASGDTVEADPARLRQVFWNIILNAAKFTPTQGAITVQTRDDGPGTIQVRITDTGKGIDPETLPRIFKPFEQGPRSETQHYGGLGLGLAIAWAITENHRGTIEAFSEGVGRGTTFTLRFPLLSAQPNAITPPPSVPAAAAHLQRLRILLVQGRDHRRRSVISLLARDKHRVTPAASAAQALAAAAAAPFDLVMSDVALPGASGLELLTVLKQRYQVKAVAILEGTGEGDQQAAEDAGILVRLADPVSTITLRQAIHSAMQL